MGSRLLAAGVLPLSRRLQQGQITLCLPQLPQSWFDLQAIRLTLPEVNEGYTSLGQDTRATAVKHSEADKGKLLKCDLEGKGLIPDRVDAVPRHHFGLPLCTVGRHPNHLHLQVRAAKGVC